MLRIARIAGMVVVDLVVAASSDTISAFATNKQ
jgi:hypothetical protein